MGVGATLFSAVAPSLAHAIKQCPYAGFPPNSCSALIDPSRFLKDDVSQRQRQNQWCWAACVSMICNWHHHPLDQADIVTRIYGGTANMPGDDQVLTRVLNDTWTDKNGASFTIAAKTFSPMMNSFNVSNADIVSDLENDKPILVGARSHATVLARVDYYDGPNGPQIVQAHVIDPWPGAASPPYYARFLAPDELVPVTSGGNLRFMALVTI